MTGRQTELHQWVIERVANYSRRAISDIDPNESFASYGMDSVYAFALGCTTINPPDCLQTA